MIYFIFNPPIINILIKIIEIVNVVLKSGWKKTKLNETAIYGIYFNESSLISLIFFWLFSIKLAVNIIKENFAKSEVVNKFLPYMISQRLVLVPSLKI